RLHSAAVGIITDFKDQADHRVALELTKQVWTKEIHGDFEEQPVDAAESVVRPAGGYPEAKKSSPNAFRIAFITDIHWGTIGIGWHMLPVWINGFEQLLEARLPAWLRANKVDMLILGGDIVESGDKEEIDSALKSLCKATKGSLGVN